MRILVTGGAGFIGSAVCRRLGAAGTPRGEVQDQEDDERDPDERRDHHEEALEDVGAHGCSCGSGAQRRSSHQGSEREKGRTFASSTFWISSHQQNTPFGT